MARPSQIEQSAHTEEIRHLLIEQRWGSRQVEAYLSMKYGEEIKDSTLRKWRQQVLKGMKQRGTLPEHWKDPDPEDHTATAQVRRITTQDDSVPDILSRRMSLIRMQEERVKIDLEHEIAMGKLFAQQSKEVKLLNEMYSEAKDDMQDLGLWPVREQATTQIHLSQQAYAASRQAQEQAQASNDQETPLNELVSGMSEEDASELGRKIVSIRRDDGDQS